MDEAPVIYKGIARGRWEGVWWRRRWDARTQTVSHSAQSLVGCVARSDAQRGLSVSDCCSTPTHVT